LGWVAISITACVITTEASTQIPHDLSTSVVPTIRIINPTGLASPVLPTLLPVFTSAPTTTPRNSTTKDVVITLGNSAGAFSFAPDGSIWVRVSPDAGVDQLWHYIDGKLVEKINIPSVGIVDGIQDFVVTENDVWILDLAGSRPGMKKKVVQLGLDGALQNSYNLPGKLFIAPTGEEITGVRELFIDNNQKLFLKGPLGVFKVFDSAGNFNPKLQTGYVFGGKVYEYGNDTSRPCVLLIDGKPSGVDIDNCYGIEVIGFASDDSFFVWAGTYNPEETNQLRAWRNFILHFDSNGGMLGLAEEPGSLPGFDPFYAISPDGQLYAKVTEGGPGQIIRLHFSQEIPKLPTDFPTP